ncbi:hypothetical protein [Leptolyngbya sp. FACHB-8]|uniref:hypothetical protein n=1 Tax=unclassified Leptolyngbya TaxID=2650499 RepID=UPI00168306B5|nr:hypothetical protein [Leptolyngbya sp. FACHB-8]MBD1911274.1 hypothetical protein [Leptolyngbya sp. FACHB-8]
MSNQYHLDSATQQFPEDALIEAGEKGICHRLDHQDVIVNVPLSAGHVDLARDIPQLYLRSLMKTVSENSFTGLKIVDCVGQPLASFSPEECGRIAYLP